MGDIQRMKTLIHWFRNFFSPEKFYVLYPNGQKSIWVDKKEALIYQEFWGGDVIKVVKKGRIK